MKIDVKDMSASSVTIKTLSLEDTLTQLKQLRAINFPLISKSVRGKLDCFEGIDLDGYEVNTNFLLNFISYGRKQCWNHILLPMPMRWPTDFDDLIDEIRLLDLHIFNSEFQEKPVKWLLKAGLAQHPKCRTCGEYMTAKCEDQTYIWKCDTTINCSMYITPILKGTFFSEYKYVSLDKILYCLYYWSTCTPPSQLSSLMQLEPMILNSIWRRLQNICRVAIERAYPRYRLSNIIPLVDFQNSDFQIIQLISIKVNELYVVCAKHPNSNMVRLGLQVPSMSSYDFAELTESWFAHGTCIRVCEPKFLALRDKRTDLSVELVTRSDMVGRAGQFDEGSAFGYLVTQLASVLKNYDSDSLSCEQLKLLLAEIQWRELYGTTPLAAFDSIVKHIVSYGEASKTYKELPRKIENLYHLDEHDESITSEYIWAEEYYYAEIESKSSESINQSVNIQRPMVRIKCHNCDFMFETYDFGVHAMMHTEEARLKSKQVNESNEVECQHCFRYFSHEDLELHASLVKNPRYPIAYCCRICCTNYNDRSNFLQHMRRYHFAHECPYRCPSCDYGSSFQQDIMIHFREEHSHEMTILCPLCLKHFAVEEPENMNLSTMREVSILIHDHMSTHYALQKGLSCDHCSLSFIKKKKLVRHKQRHHNPMEILDPEKVYIDPFKVDERSNTWAVKALRLELFIANKQPNIRSDRPVDYFSNDVNSTPNKPRKNHNKVIELDNEPANMEENGSIATNSDSIAASASLAADDQVVREEGNSDYEGIKKFLSGGHPTLTFPRPGAKDNNKLSSGKLIEALSKLPKADGVIPNLSVLLTPSGKPALCLECRTPVTCDHYVETIKCQTKDCPYMSMCPRAVVMHQNRGHPKIEEFRKVPSSKAYKMYMLNGLEFYDKQQQAQRNLLASKQKQQESESTSHVEPESMPQEGTSQLQEQQQQHDEQSQMQNQQQQFQQLCLHEPSQTNNHNNSS